MMTGLLYDQNQSTGLTACVTGAIPVLSQFATKVLSLFTVIEVAFTPAKDAFASVSTKLKPLPIKIMAFWLS